MHDRLAATLAERQATHGDFTEVSDVAQSLKAILRSASGFARMPAAQREAVEAIALKLARACCGDPLHLDHWTDIAGYARLAETRCP